MFKELWWWLTDKGDTWYLEKCPLKTGGHTDIVLVRKPKEKIYRAGGWSNDLLWADVMTGYKDSLKSVIEKHTDYTLET
jgi:hypothetical protein